MRANIPDAANMVSQSNFYTGLFLITACTLMLQVIQTRISHTTAVANSILFLNWHNPNDHCDLRDSVDLNWSFVYFDQEDAN